MNMLFNLFLGGVAWDVPPSLYIDSDPPAFIGLKSNKQKIKIHRQSGGNSTGKIKV